jgi:hypothetical protein
MHHSLLLQWLLPLQPVHALAPVLKPVHLQMLLAVLSLPAYRQGQPGMQ